MNGKEKVLAQFDFCSEQKVHWKIYYGYGILQSNLAASTEVIPGELDAKLSREKLQESLDFLEPGEYLIQFKDEPNSNKNIINCRFKIGHEYNREVVNQTESPAMRGYMSPQFYQQLLNAEIGKVKATFEKEAAIAEIRAEIKELKKKGTGASEWVQGLKELLPMVQGLMNKEQPALQPAVIRGPKADPATNEQQIERRKWFTDLNNEAMKELMQDEGGGDEGFENVCILLWSLNEYRKANPGLWNTFKPEILKFAEKLKVDD